MAHITLGGLLQVPENIRQSLEQKSQQQGRELAEGIIDYFSSKDQSGESEEQRKPSVDELTGINKGKNWGGGGW